MKVEVHELTKNDLSQVEYTFLSHINGFKSKLNINRD